MRTSRLVRLILATASLVVVKDARPQQPFDLDTTFRTEINTWYVSSILTQADGRVIISGQLKFPGDLSFRSGARLNVDGSWDPSFASPAYMGGKLTSWNGRVYQQNGPGIRRSWPDGALDTDYVINPPYVSPLQGGDYHVYSDGRILLSGVHVLSDSIRGFEGLYCLCWLSNTGYLDTTKTHRQCAGSLDFFTELPSGSFIGSLGNPPNTASWEGTATGSNVIRFNDDGQWDSTFQANVWWGQAYGFLPLADGRVYAGGNFRIAGDPDTLHLVRFLPDGSLDPTFNNHLDFRTINLSGSVGAVVGREFLQIDAGRLIITGGFEIVDGQPRQGICLIDTAGNLLNDYFSGPGCGDYTYQSFTYGGAEGIVPAPDGSYYIWGAYHGYDDGTNNDTLQRMVSRLYGFNVGLGENQDPQMPVTAHPNPGGDHIRFNALEEKNAVMRVFDARGVLVMQAQVRPNEGLDVSGLLPGFYVIMLRTTDGGVHRIKWVKE